MSHNFKKKSAKAIRLRITGLGPPTSLLYPWPAEAEGAPRVSCSFHWSHLDPKAPVPASTSRRRQPLALQRGGAAHRNRFSAWPGRQEAGAGRTSQPPRGGSPGIQA